MKNRTCGCRVVCATAISGVQVEAADLLTGDMVPLYNPRTNNWDEHFSWSADGAKIVGLTSVGRATVVALKLNNEVAVEVRRRSPKGKSHPPYTETLRLDKLRVPDAHPQSSIALKTPHSKILISHQRGL